jgi:serine phosphatase RsbU (regulator of sigma subunit)
MDGQVPLEQASELLRRVIDTSFEPSMLVRRADPATAPGTPPASRPAAPPSDPDPDTGSEVDPDAERPPARLVVSAANVAAADLLATTEGRRYLTGRPLDELMPWAAASGLLAALDEALETGIPLRIHDHEYEDVSEPGGRRIRRSLSVGALPTAPGLLLVTLRPHQSAAGTDPAWEEKLHRLAGTGPWEWDVPDGVVYWWAQALAVLGSSDTPGPMPVEQPPYRVHKDDLGEHDAFLAALAAGGPAGHTEIRVVQPNGPVRHIRFGGEPMRDEDGGVRRVFGSVQDVTDRRRTQTALEIAEVQLAARRRRADAERELAVLLQQIIMPTGPSPEDLPGMTVAARYRPASAAAGVGGDWYGVVPLPGGKVLLHVGDVAGHGFAAATAMARLYHALQGLAITGAAPARLLHWLNKLTCAQSDFTIASACCAVYDPAARTLRLADAGHPSPVLVRDGEAAALPKPSGAMLGMDAETVFEEQEHAIRPGDILLLYTDGLIERRRLTPDRSTELLLEQSADPPQDLDVYTDRILRNMRSDTDDDACLLVVRFT